MFERFGLSVCNARRQGDVDPSKKLLADTNKLIGNSCYGKIIMDKEKHSNVCYVEGDRNASVKMRSRLFRSAEEIDDNLYEVISAKAQVSSPLYFFCSITHHSSYSFIPQHQLLAVDALTNHHYSL